LLSWPNYVSPATLESFTQESGISVSLDVVPSADELEARMCERALSPPQLVAARPFVI
jgi:spermidine/putrescine-binding protein